MDKVISENEEEIIDEYNKDCPFCRGNEHYTPESRFKIEDENGWTVRSTDNKFPIVDKFQELIHKKEKNKIAQIVFITGLRGCRKNDIYH